jgi:hypothetical protein
VYVLRHLVGIMIWIWLPGERVDCILNGLVVVWYTYVVVWRFLGRNWCVDFVLGMVCVSNR